MSKSLGTGIDPLELIPTYGADGLRFGLLAMSSAQDVRFNEEKIAQGQALANKLFNASRLVLLRVDPGAEAAPRPRTAEDRWILSRLERAVEEVSGNLDAFDFSHAALALYDFVYGELCDWYLELVKPRLREGDADLSATLLYVLTETLALAHPMIPFVTEEIYAHVPGASGLLAARVQSDAGGPLDETAEASLARTIEAVQALRAWRDATGVKAGALIGARLSAEGYDETIPQIARLARLSLTIDGGDPVASVPVPGGIVEILPSEGLDIGAAEEKRAAQRSKLEQEIARSEAKLANQGFVAKAPPAVVGAERDKLERLRAELEAL
jgi:valyl-tRNA synthetase